MTCFQPLKGWRSKTVNDNGKRSIVFNVNEGFKDLPITIPCGQCIGCRLDKSKQWALRCSHEASLYKDNSFITLTYNDANLPPNSSLNISHFQLFMKKLRKHYPPKSIRYYHCGEYGEKYRRPHYHACLFNVGFPDKRAFKKTKTGDILYTSEKLTKIWGKGHASIGRVTYKSAAYVARYCMKKINGDQALETREIIDPDTGEIHQLMHYQHLDERTGDIHQLAPEYTTMSFSIGSGWLDKFQTDVYPDDFIVHDGKKQRVPKSYDLQYEKAYPSDYRRVRFQRLAKSKLDKENQTPERLRVREQVQSARLKQLPRNLKE